MSKNVVNALIEIPLGSRNKYELNAKTGRIHLDRVLGYLATKDNGKEDALRIIEECTRRYLFQQ